MIYDKISNTARHSMNRYYHTLPVFEMFGISLTNIVGESVVDESVAEKHHKSSENYASI